ncbi:spore germination protein [Metabacillus sp. Hm71]|uniref:spore germination protein n=1 Tax=Metabacillus sp. Hm71 TaxID=3450743 RepID=UPI003F43E80B
MNHIWRKLLHSKTAIKTPTAEQFTQEQDLLSDNLADNENKFRSVYKDCSDVIFRPFFIGGKDKAILIYIDGLSNIEEIDDNVLSPLMQNTEEQFHDVNSLIEKRISVSDVKEIKTFFECIHEISLGNPVILVDKRKTGFSLGLSKWEKRSVEEPSAEMVVRGPREAFVETLRVNTSLLRRKIRSPKLKMQSMEVGRYTKTKVVISYMEGIADKTLIEETKNRLSRIEIDGILESGMIEEFIEDNPYSPFPQVLETERPDVVTSNLLEGRVAILVDGTPFSLVVPTTLYSLLQSAEDYYGRFLIGTAIRWLRYLFLVISLLLPSLYVAVITFHHEMVPTTLLISMAASREQVPFPALIEVLIMEVTFEALREAGLRLPKQVGAAVSIVGALVIGEAAVSAGIVSAPMVMVVAITGIASFTIPRYSASIAIRMLRFPMILLAGTLGLLGIMLGIITIIVHLCTLRSFGVPYLSPMAPMKFRDMKDVLIRAPWWKLNTRPHFTGSYNKYRQSTGQKPDPTNGDE